MPLPVILGIAFLLSLLALVVAFLLFELWHISCRLPFRRHCLHTGYYTDEKITRCGKVLEAMTAKGAICCNCRYFFGQVGYKYKVTKNIPTAWFANPNNMFKVGK